MGGQKDFDVWNTKKKRLDSRWHILNFNEAEIWWCAIGLNVGGEEDGKNLHFERPVCVLRKFNKELFIGVPLTSARKDSPFFFPYTLNNVEGSILISQARVLSAKRLERRLGRIGRDRFSDLRKQYRNLYG